MDILQGSKKTIGKKEQWENENRPRSDNGDKSNIERYIIKDYLQPGLMPDP